MSENSLIKSISSLTEFILLSQQDREDGILTGGPWQFDQSHQNDIVFFRRLWKSASLAINEEHEDLFFYGQRFNLNLRPMKSLSSLEKKFSDLSQDLFEKFLIMVGIHLSNQRIYLASMPYRKKLLSIFKQEELDKIFCMWPQTENCPQSSLPLELFLEEIKILGWLGAANLFGNTMLWKLNSSDYEKFQKKIAILKTRPAEIFWIDYRYFHRFLRWFS